MKNKLALILGLAVAAILVLSCKDKNNKDAITPDYSATGNPYPNNQTVTGTTTYTNPATNNTSFVSGDVGWSNPSCLSTGGYFLKGVKGATELELKFANPVIISSTPTTYTLSIAKTPIVGSACALTVINAPDQPAGIVWIGQGGSVVVTTNTSGISASLNNVICTQQSFNFPQVTVNGGVSCSNN